ncbi:uncharacterized protein C8Q71DRAFT_862225 [Rhodofomes roseus]|uniref:Uncharacterized protein n=1 Tax=Rhodofomes roseus TaxID=34475 RepID=A0ABQ8K347_9APHY|nr:uncharacterized protein C8Q71DRAFT_862225 [Rhodofomes roseus]KAH9830775.1 hypothetical protein C8Q71DRAFT_862225 [Rhodofomes roseus]
MFLTFSAGKKKPIAPSGKALKPPNDRRIRTHRPNPPSYAVAVDITVDEEPEVDKENGTETWIVDKEPERSLARGHILTMWRDDHVIGSGRISKVDGLSRHWVTFRLAGARDGLRVRVPVPWAGLSGYASHTHTSQYHMLSPIPEPHVLFKDTPPFADPESNPYQFELTCGKEIRLRAKLEASTHREEPMEEPVQN